MVAGRALVARFFLYAYTLLIVALSLQPHGTATVGSWDKLAHFGAYALFTLLAFIAFRETRRFLMVCIAISILGVLLELGQSLVPGRFASALDALTNAGGVAVAALFCVKCGGRTPERPRSRT